ncbi:MAG: Undecaprenyl-phosphate mannosyltransferase [Candidatus Lokiarchaeum sp. GC14_75]|nr:MAG: Undecaprenyl-phosphate mannosyltransferase [Candidatus Lokiarchaeum sp. GC14_75]
MFDISEEKIDILLLIPCFNEEENIENILEHLRYVKQNLQKRSEFNLEILIINDGSTDRTMQILEKNNQDSIFIILNYKENKGYGYSLINGFKYAKEMKFSWIISFDMDGQHEPKYLYKFIELILENPPEQIISGSRYKISDLFWQNPWKDRFLVNAIITGILNTVGLSITDAFCGLKAYECNAINDLELKINGYEIPIEIWIKSMKKGYKIAEKEVPLIYKDRDAILKNAKDSFLFKKGEERIEKYIHIIESLLNTPLKTNIKVFKSIFSNYFNSVDDINKYNFKKIQESIFTQIRELET